ncbi:hypothetical protein V2J09_002005 [Rumex salicifolius]
MESIKPLPERVRSSVRSGFIISDMIRVVEELVYNSLDAGSTKVSVSVGVGRGYVKVEDNGCGISRDGLVLLGERYATSKHDTIPETSSGLRIFGNRGEVLCSIADVSMLEIITKAKGRPNGYRKIMKGSNCLHLGIDNDRWDAGTTVVVHDIFYNQPVRRMHMQTSPKKVLHSIKKSVLQIALVRPQVIFSIVDIESEGELLRTHSSSSPLALLISHYGIKVAHLHELSLSEGPFELAGYISIDVNSRFIVKSPIHKSLNRIASTFWEQLNSKQGGKRSRPQACATYCLNLTCPQSLYELNIEQLKTSVEFKDWLSLLSFIEKSVASLWRNTTSNGQLFSSTAEPTSKHHMRKDADIIVSTNIDADFLDTFEIPKKRCKIQKNQSSQPDLNSSLFPMEAETPETSQLPYHRDSAEVTGRSKGELKDDMYWMCRSRPYNHSDFGSFPIMDCLDRPWDITNKVTTVGEDRNPSFIKRDRNSVHDDGFNSEEMAESPIRIMDDYERNYAETNPEILRPFQFEDDKKLYRRNCSSPESAYCAYINNRSSLENLHAVSFISRDQFELHSHNCESNGEYMDPRDKLAEIYSERTPSQEDFMEDQFSTRNYNSYREDQISYQEMDNEPDPNVTHYLPSALQEVSGCLLHNCTSMKNTNEFIGEMWSEFQCDDGVLRADSMNFYDVNENLDEFQSGMWRYNMSSHFPFNRSKVESARSKGSLFCDQEYAAAGRENCHSVQEFGGFNANFESSDTECGDMISDSISGVNSWDFEHQSLQEQAGNARSRNHANCKNFNHEKKDFNFCAFDDGFTNEDYLSNGYSNSRMKTTSESGDRDAEDSRLFGRRCCGKLSASRSNILGRERNITFPETINGFTVSSSLCEHPMIHVKSIPEICQPRSNIKHRNVDDEVRRKRSHSAPPIYRGKRRFLPLHANSNSLSADTDKRIPTGNREAKKEKIIQHSTSQCNQFPETSPIKGLPLHIGPKMKESLYSPDVANTRNKKLDSTVHAYGHSKINNAKFIQHSSSQHDQIPGTSPIEGFRLRTGRNMKEAVNMPDVTKTQNEVKLDNSLQGYDVTDLGVKWRDGCPQAGSEYLQNYQMIRGKSTNCQDRYTILNVSSGILHLASATIVPKSINRNCLEASKILMQVDKKFIPVVAGKVLAVIDQHAADERIRLEDLRHKVLSGNMKTVAYLEEEKEMMLPETVYQLLYNYTEQIKHWGWICNIFQDSPSFSKNLNVLNKQPGTIRLLAVPCILGVNLSDDDLLEYIQQLAETDGSSTVPPSVLRILNYKACRGAIMFGDTLLPSECSLIVEELKRTSLCFQCAHGRPTMAPLVNLEALHKQIKNLCLCKDDSSKAWHGLQRQPIALERAKLRLGMNV